MNNAEQKQFFQRCLYGALMQLIQEKKFEKISIGELCDRAGVSRMTYYRSYINKEDIFLQHLDECFSEYRKGLKVQDFYGVSLSFFTFWKEQERDFLNAVVRSGLSHQLMGRFYTYLDDIIPSMVQEQEIPAFVRSFLAGGLYKMLVDWMKNGCLDKPEEMSVFLAAGSRALTELQVNPQNAESYEI